VSIHAVCELEAGAELARDASAERARLAEVLQQVVIAYPDRGFALLYGTLFAALERAGERIGQMDLLIATAALSDGAPLVTGNTREFRRVPGLRLLTYRSR
jgi:tRNA(fMet)-specific endonuclease VapC